MIPGVLSTNCHWNHAVLRVFILGYQPLETQIATKSRRRDDEEGSDRDRGAHRGMTHPDEPMRETKRRTVTSTRQRMA